MILPLEIRIAPTVAEARFPVANPVIEWQIERARRREEMEVIRHEDITAHNPGSGLLPDSNQRAMILAGCEPRPPVPCADRQEDDRRPVRIEHDTVSRTASRMHRKDPTDPR